MMSPSYTNRVEIVKNSEEYMSRNKIKNGNVHSRRFSLQNCHAIAINRRQHVLIKETVMEDLKESCLKVKNDILGRTTYHNLENDNDQRKQKNTNIPKVKREQDNENKNFKDSQIGISEVY